MAAVAILWTAAPALAQMASDSQAREITVKARGLLAGSKPGEARALLEKELADRPNNGMMLGAYADVLTVLGDRETADAARFKACAFFDTISCERLALDPIPGGEPTSLDTVGSRCMSLGVSEFQRNAKEAVRHFVCATEAVPSSAMAQASLAMALVKSGQSRKAKEPLRKACDLGHVKSCARLELIADLEGAGGDAKYEVADRSGPTHTVILKDGRILTGDLREVRGAYVVQTGPQAEELQPDEISEIYALVDADRSEEESTPWREGAFQLGLGLGYSASVRTLSPSAGGEIDDTLHTLMGKVSAGYLFTSGMALEGFVRLAATLSDKGQHRLFLQAGPAFHFIVPMSGFAIRTGPLLGVEATVVDPQPVDINGRSDELQSAVGFAIGGDAGVLVPIDTELAIGAGLTLAYVYATGETGSGATRGESRLRALFEVELLWYP
jgi:hypothetical protein